MIYTKKYMREAAADPDTQEDANAAEVVNNIESNVADEILGMEPDQVADVTVEVPEDKQVDIAIDPVSDPVSECYAIMFEEEYNYNSIMQTIGVYELSEAARGRDVIYEAVDVKAFIGKIIEWLKGIAAKVAEMFMKIMGDMKMRLNATKKFADDHANEIIRGWGYLDCDIYDFDKEKLKVLTKKNAKLDDLMEKAKKITNNDAGKFDKSEETAKEFDLENAESICGFKPEDTDISKLNDELVKDIIGDKVKVKDAKNVTPNSVLDSMRSSNEFKLINQMYNTSKQYYVSLMSTINKLEGESKNYDNSNDFMKFSSFVIERIRFAAKVEQMHKAVVAKACKLCDYQTRYLATQAVKKAGEAFNRTNDSEPTVQHNSTKMFNASKTFGSVDLI